MRVLTSGIIAVGCICSASASLNLPCGTVLTPEDKGYSNATYIDNGGAGRERLPSLVVMAECAEDVPVALKYAKSNNISFSVKGGGHSAAGYSLVRDGITVDMSLMNASRIETDAATGDSILWVQAGATFGHVYSRLNDTGLILAGGGCSTVGVSGFMLGGGLSFLSRAFGLGVDNVVSLRMVTVDGELITVSDQNETLADLWWALRGGGGGNFGVVIDMEIKLHPGEDATTSADVCWKGSEASIAALKQYSRWLESDSPWPGTAHPNVGAPALLIRDSNHSGGAPYPIDFCVTLFALGDVNVSSEVESLIRFVNSSVPAVIQTDGCAGPTATFYEWESRCGALKTGVDGDFGYMTSGVFGIGAMSDGDAASKLVNGLAVTPGDRTIINFHDGGGEIRNASKGGSFAHRDFNLIYQIKGIWVEESRSEENFEWGKALQASLAPYISGAYVNYIDPWLQEWQTAYYGSNYDKLVSIKKTVDPDNFFHFNQSLGANSTPSPTPAPSASCDADALVQQMYSFQDGQNAQDAHGLAQMYTVDGKNFIPATAAAVVGRDAIEASFAEYFSTLASIHETVVGPMIVNGNMGTFAKTIETTPKLSTGSAKTTHVINWFEFDCSDETPLISSFTAMFNATTFVV